MTGSEKQIRWAEDLKEQASSTLDKVVAELKVEANAAQAADLDAAVEWVLSHAEAKWWIENARPGIYVGSILRCGLEAIDSDLLAMIPRTFCGSLTLDGKGSW